MVFSWLVTLELGESMTHSLVVDPVSQMAQGKNSHEQSKQKALAGYCLLLLLVDGVSLRNWVKFLGLILLAWVLLRLVVITSVVGMTFADAVFVAN